MGGRQRTETEKEGDRYANQDLNAFKKIIKLLEVIRWLILDVVTIRRYKNFPQTINVDMFEPCNWYLKISLKVMF